MSALNELIPTLMSVGFILDLSIPLTASADSLSLDLKVILKVLLLRLVAYCC